MKILTVTLNPAFDLHAMADRLAAQSENFAIPTLRQAGGKGVNVSRALLATGKESLAFVLLGEENGSEFSAALEREGLSICSLTVPGRIRENLTIHVEGEKETRISLSSPLDLQGRLAEIRAFLCNRTDPGDILLLAGSLPDGCDKESMIQMLVALREKGARIAVDSRSFSAEDLQRIRPWLIKPNEEELSALCGSPVRTQEDALRCATQLHREGMEHVFVTRGGDGSLLVCNAGVFTAHPPRVTVRSTVGAGDSSVAGFLSAYAEGESPAGCLRRAVAYGSAACLREGTSPPEKDCVEKLLSEITVEEWK